MKRIVLAAVAVVTAVSLVACGSMMMNNKPTVTVPLGILLDQTGSFATPSWKVAVELAISHANAGLEAAGDSTRFSAAFSDSANMPDIAKSRAQALVADAGAKAIVMQTAPLTIHVNSLNYSSDGGPTLGVPVMCGNCLLPSINNPMATDMNPDLQAGSRDVDNWLFRSVAANDKDAAIIVRLLTATNMGDANNDGQFKIAIYAAAGAAFNSFRAGIETAAKAVRADAIVEKGVQFPMTLNPDSYAFNADIDRLVDNLNSDVDGGVDVKPDAIVELSAAGISVAFTKAYKTRGETTRLIHNTNFRSVLAIDTLQDAANGQEGTSPVVVEQGTSGSTFATAFTAKAGTEPFLQDSNFYDGTMSLMLATLIAVKTNNLSDASSVTPAQIRAAMSQLSHADGEKVGTGPDEFKKAVGLISAGTKINYDGASGPMDFDAVGNVKARVVRWEVQNKKFVDTERYDCVADPACPKSP